MIKTFATLSASILLLYPAFSDACSPSDFSGKKDGIVSSGFDGSQAFLRIKVGERVGEWSIDMPKSSYGKPIMLGGIVFSEDSKEGEALVFNMSENAFKPRHLTWIRCLSGND